jgi:hypothetical protein
MLLVDKLLEDEQLLDTVYVKALDMHNISRIISAVISFSREEAYAAIF